MSLFRKVAAGLAAFALLAASCGDGDESPLTMAEYIGEMEAIALDFFGDAEPGEEGPPEGGYPLGGDLVAATDLYTSYDDLLAAWDSLMPPPQIAPLHEDLVAALDRLQEKVGDYLMDEALEEGEIQFEAIGQKVNAEILGAEGACFALRRAIAEEGFDSGAIFRGCVF